MGARIIGVLWNIYGQLTHVHVYNVVGIFIHIPLLMKGGCLLLHTINATLKFDNLSNYYSENTEGTSTGA